MKASSTIRSGIVSGKVMTADLLWRDKAFPESFGTVPASRPAIRTMTRDSGRAKLHWETCSFDRTATVPNDRSTIRFHSDRFSLKFTSRQIPISQRLFRLFIHFRNSCYIDSDLIAILHVSQYFSVDTRFQSWKSCLRFVLRIRSTFHWALFSAFVPDRVCFIMSFKRFMLKGAHEWFFPTVLEHAFVQTRRHSHTLKATIFFGQQ